MVHYLHYILGGWSKYFLAKLCLDPAKLHCVHMTIWGGLSLPINLTDLEITFQGSMKYMEIHPKISNKDANVSSFKYAYVWVSMLVFRGCTSGSFTNSRKSSQLSWDFNSNIMCCQNWLVALCSKGFQWNARWPRCRFLHGLLQFLPRILQ